MIKIPVIIKNIATTGFALLLIAIIVVSPYFLLIDLETYGPLVLTVWLLSAVYYVFIRGRQK